MKICKLILPVLLCLTSLSLYGEAYLYIKGGYKYEITEISDSYLVKCTSTNKTTRSTNKNITDRQLRMNAIDLIGAYILYKDSEFNKTLGPDYFEVYANGLDFHYQAILEGMESSTKNSNSQTIIFYKCKKDAYKIVSATYNKAVDIETLLISNYRKNKSENSASLLYRYKNFSSNHYISLEKDYLTGNVLLSSGVRLLQNTEDRIELSMFSSSENNMPSMLDQAKNEVPQKIPFKHFYYTELVTAAKLKEKGIYYEKWRQSLNDNGCVYEAILEYCSKSCNQPVPSEETVTLSSLIEAFPGAVSPFGIRCPIDIVSYIKASQEYAASNFTDAAIILTEIIDNEGISPQILNLTGASYRFLNQPEKAISYLLLCYKLDPNTQYLAGNIYLCLKQMGFPRLLEAKELFYSDTLDTWSKNILSDE